jgi:hypothetical protein
MKTVLLAAALLWCGAGFAASTRSGFTDTDSGIVTPDVATGILGFYTFSSDASGGMQVCYEKDTEATFGYNKCKRWTPVRQVAKDLGREFVGFRVVSGVNGHRLLEVYWK